MITTENSILKIAEIVARISEFAYPPFYEEEKGVWERMDDNDDEYGKPFFIAIANYIIKVISTSENKVESLAAILSEIHSHRLEPFFGENLAEDDDIPDGVSYWNGKWDSLEDISSDEEDVDKRFFRRMAEKIIGELDW